MAGDALARQLEHGAALHRGGRLQEAIAAYRRVSRQHRKAWQPLHLLGIAHYQLGELDQARAMLERAAELAPDMADVWYYLGETLRSAGNDGLAEAYLQRAAALAPGHFQTQFQLAQLAETRADWPQAELRYRAACSAMPESAEARTNLGNVLRMLGRRDEAREQLERAVSLKPDLVAAHVNLGVLLEQAYGDLGAAIEHYGRAVDAGADDPEAHFHLACALVQHGELQAAVEHYGRVLELAPAHGRAWNNLAVIYRDAGMEQESRACLERAVVADPTIAEAWANLALACLRDEQFDRAADGFERALRLRPQFPEALNGRGTLHWERRDLAHARADFEAALALRPGFGEAAANLAALLHLTGDLEGARSWYDRAIEAAPTTALKVRAATMVRPIMASVEQIDADRAALDLALDRLLASSEPACEEDLLRFPDTPFFLAYHGRQDRQLLEKIARVYTCACPSLAITAPQALERLEGDRPIRIGFLSRFFYHHSVGRFFNPIIEALAQLPQFEVSVFALGTREDECTQRLEERCGRFIRLQRDNLGEARKRIAAERLDVLVYPEIGMDPFTYLLAFARLARVQCVLQGHSVTTGIPSIDYYVSSDLIEPPGAEAQYTEKLVRLQCLPMHIEPPAPATPATRSELGLPEHGTFYLCPMKLQKVHPEMDSAVRDILRGDPDGFMVFVQEPGNSFWHEQLQRRLQTSLQAEMSRVHFVPWRSGEGAFLGLVGAADVILDSFHHGGATTSHLCLASGKPVVSWVTDTSRTGFIRAYYTLLEVDDCIAHAAREYVDIALRLGRDSRCRAKLSERILAARYRLYHHDRVFLEYAAFFEDVGRKHPPLAAPGWPYRPLQTTSCSSHGAARGAVALAPAGEVHLPWPLIFGQHHPQGRVAARLPEPLCRELRELEVVGGEGVVLATQTDEVLCDAARYPEDRVAMDSPLVIQRLKGHVLLRNVPKLGEAIEKGIWLAGRGAHNYYHWMLEYLPRLRWLEDLPEYDDWPLLVDEGLHGNLHRALERLLKRPRNLIALRPQARQLVRRLLTLDSGVWMPLEFHPGALVSASDILFSSDALSYLRKSLMPRPARGGRRFYLSRATGRYRRLVNDGEVQAVFRKAGFEPVDPECLSFDDQVELFSQADAIAGPTGAAFTNMIFAPKGCRILIMYYAGAPFYYFSNLADALGHRLMYVLGEPVRDSHPILYQRDFALAPELALRAWQALERREPS
jgi:predicted O-linked N-acetylglucosamine transferase (SPINDLY family)